MFILLQAWAKRRRGLCVLTR